MEEAWKRKQEAEAEIEAEAVEGRLEEADAEAKEKLTAVPSLVIILWGFLTILAFKIKKIITDSFLSVSTNFQLIPLEGQLS